MANKHSGLTGNIRYRATFRKKLVLQVEERVLQYFEGPLSPNTLRQPVYRNIWRDGKVEDFEVLCKLKSHQGVKTG